MLWSAAWYLRRSKDLFRFFRTLDFIVSMNYKEIVFLQCIMYRVNPEISYILWISKLQQRITSMQSASSSSSCHPKEVHCWTWASPKACQSDLSWAIRINCFPATPTRSSHHLVTSTNGIKTLKTRRVLYNLNLATISTNHCKYKVLNLSTSL